MFLGDVSCGRHGAEAVMNDLGLGRVSCLGMPTTYVLTSSIALHHCIYFIFKNILI